MLGHWLPPSTVSRMVTVSCLPRASSSDFMWTGRSSIKTAQLQTSEVRPPIIILTEDIWVNDFGEIWVPNDAADLYLCLCVIDKTPSAKHRGQKATEILLRQNYFWSTLTADIRTFVSACVHRI